MKNIIKNTSALFLLSFISLPVSADTTRNSDHIGKGFNYISKEPTLSHCLNESNLGSATLHKNKKSYYTRKISNTDEIKSVFNTAVTKPFNETFSTYEKSVFNNYKKMGNPPAVMYQLSIEKDEIIAKNAFPKLNTQAMHWLETGDKDTFRKYCGDGVIDSVVTGNSISVLVYVMSQSKTWEERHHVAKYLTGAISSGGDILQNYIDNHPEYDFIIDVNTQIDNLITSDWTLDNLVTRLVEFETSDFTHNSVLSYNTNHYIFPTTLSDKSHWELFNDYRPHLNKIESWDSLIQSYHSTRCLSVNNNDKNMLCDLTEQKYQIMGNLCANHETWADCVKPDDKACTLEDGSYCDVITTYEIEPIACENDCSDNNNTINPGTSNQTAKQNSTSGGSIGLFSLLCLMIILALKHPKFRNT
ncbi:hypothetical protein MHO82_23180 [Vibrio sp. Of7-15]|uniref:hypothetical protein n=1 Tax=Vibrio sp. Of7-15 TaxID=2724879 RepID=UPI001EF38A20|nr:hypothetical protein [Vibrio sp. Of7-15]MCG7499774.1 hypothetical protein [Vibrio sp. Of7-15]